MGLQSNVSFLIVASRRRSGFSPIGWREENHTTRGARVAVDKSQNGRFHAWNKQWLLAELLFNINNQNEITIYKYVCEWPAVVMT